MKLLVATKQTQGQRTNDFCHAVEGEIVLPHLDCDHEEVDGFCGCRRSWSGATSHKATTTMRVVNIPMSVNTFKGIIRKSLEAGGWLSIMTPDDAAQTISDCIDDIKTVSEAFDLGDIVERRGSNFVLRERKTRRKIEC
jgi:hypothetical protein